MKYKDLAVMINKLSEEQQNCDVSIWDPVFDEMHPMMDFVINQQGSQFEDVLDIGHPVITI